MRQRHAEVVLHERPGFRPGQPWPGVEMKVMGAGLRAMTEMPMVTQPVA